MSIVLALDRIGVGIDTARYGHRVCFMKPDRQPAAQPLTVLESRTGYAALKGRLDQLHKKYPEAHFHVRIDAAGQYATNLEHFLRGLALPMTLSIGEPKRNKDYQKAHFPKRTTDDTESQAMARFAVVELPAATPPVPHDMITLREVAGRLQANVKQSTQAINRLHNLLARVFPELANLTNDVAAPCMLQLLDRYPTPQRIGHARLATLEKIPYLTAELATQIHLVAQQSVASLSGELAETLVRDLVAQVRHTQRVEEQMRRLLTDAYAALPSSPHRQVATIPGVGEATAAVVVAKAVDVNRFATPNHFVGYFGVFPEENTSGVDKFGNPLPPGTMCMSAKGNDLVRSYLWNAARSAIRHNPAIAALHRRLRAKGTRGDVAMGHCMRKLLHLIYAVWKTDRPFDVTHFAWEKPHASAAGASASAPPVAPTPQSGLGQGNTASGTHEASDPSMAAAVPNVPPAPAADVLPATAEPTPGRVPASAASPGHDHLEGNPVQSVSSSSSNETAVGHKRDVPAKEQVVTTATPTVAPPPPPVKPPKRAARPKVDFTFLRQQVTMKQVLEHLHLLDGLRGRGHQRRGRCPIHGQAGDAEPTFSAHLGKHAFQCFHADCGAQGNVLDLWAAIHKLPLYEAALHLAETFRLPRNREEEPVPGTR